MFTRHWASDYTQNTRRHYHREAVNERTRSVRHPQVCTITAHYQGPPFPLYEALQADFRYVVLAKFLYSSSAWWGFTTAYDRSRIEAVVRRGVRAGLYPADGPEAAQLVEDYDDILFTRLLRCELNFTSCMDFYPTKVTMTIISDLDPTVLPSLAPWTTVTLYIDWHLKTCTK